MQSLIEFSQAQSEAMVMCLIASLFWAGLLFAAARMVERDRGGRLSERVWTITLALAIAPSLLAPALAHVGVSLRAPVENGRSVGDFVSYAVVAEASAPAAAVETATAASPALSAEDAIALAALVYAYGVALALVAFVCRNAMFSLAVARAPLCRDEALGVALAAWARRYGLARTPRVRRSRYASSVCVYGVARPTIIVPAAIDSRVGREDLVMMCAHELAHVRRGDTRLFTATALARALFWFNPFVKAIAARIELAAEEGADALVLKAGADRRAYAQCFVEGLKFAAAQAHRPLAYAPSFTPQGRDGRRRRLNAILSAHGERKMSLSARLMMGAAAGAALLGALGQAAYAVDPDAAAQKRRENAEAKAPPPAAAQESPRSLIMTPVAGEHTAAYGKTVADPASGALLTHSGIDIKAAKGARVVAAGDGVVVEATDRFSNNPDWGKVVVIDHGHGLITRYAHLDSYSVKKGDRVKAGERIAAVGATGKVTGPHLHFEALMDGKSVDPVAAIAPVSAAAPPAPPAPIDAESEAVVASAFAWSETPNAAPAVAVAAPSDFMFAFGDAPPPPPSAARLEDTLEDILAGRDEGEYDLTLSIDGERLTLSDERELTDADREKLRAMIAKLRAREARSKDDLRRAEREAARSADQQRIIVRRSAGGEDQVFAFASPDRRGYERDIAMVQLEALDAELEALSETRIEIPFDFDEAIADALADLEDARSDIRDDPDLSAKDRSKALADLDRARAQLAQERASGRDELAAQLRRIDKSIERLKRQRDALAAEIERREN